jgi:hypothetical protein
VRARNNAQRSVFEPTVVQMYPDGNHACHYFCWRLKRPAGDFTLGERAIRFPHGYSVEFWQRLKWKETLPRKRCTDLSVLKFVLNSKVGARGPFV